MNRRHFLKAVSASITFPVFGYSEQTKPELTGIDLIINEIRKVYLSGEVIPSYKYQDECGSKKYASPLGVILYKNLGWNVFGREALEKIMSKYSVTKIELAQMCWGFDSNKYNIKHKNAPAFQKAFALRKELKTFNIEYDTSSF